VSSTSSNSDRERNAREAAAHGDAERAVLNDREFRGMLARERKRSERTQAPFLLMQAECGDLEEGKESRRLRRMATVLLNDSRATDIIGWYQDGTALGVLFTGLAQGDRGALLETIAARVKATFNRDLTPEEQRNVQLEFRFFPDAWDLSDGSGPGSADLYVDASCAYSRKQFLQGVKRAIDIIFSATVLILLSPLLLWIALAIKVTSKGPLFYRQKRIGQFGKQFGLLKFRTMYEVTDERGESRFVRGLIKNNAPLGRIREDHTAPNQLRGDLRITRIGRLLRSTNLDELPRLLNVFKGEMSLVGPRPAIPYEVEAYQTWHRRRVLAAKPGITGVYRLSERNSVNFDDLVRMELRYAMAWSPWLDLKILFFAPWRFLGVQAPCEDGTKMEFGNIGNGNYERL